MEGVVCCLVLGDYFAVLGVSAFRRRQRVCIRLWVCLSCLYSPGRPVGGSILRFYTCILDDRDRRVVSKRAPERSRAASLLLNYDKVQRTTSRLHDFTTYDFTTFTTLRLLIDLETGFTVQK